MKFHVLYISFAIALLTHSCQAAPLLGNVADISDDRVDVAAAGVHMDSQGVNLNDQGTSSLLKKKRQEQQQADLIGGTINSAEKLVTGALATTNPGAIGSQLNRRQAIDGLVGGFPVVGSLLGGGGGEAATPAMKKRSPLLDNQGDDSVGAKTNGGLVSGLLGKRQGAGRDPSLIDGTLNTVLATVDPGLKKKRSGSNDDDGDDLLKLDNNNMPPPGATYGSGMAANNPTLNAAAMMDAMTKRGSEDEEGGDDNDASSNGENNQDRPGPPPPGLTDEQLDDYFTKRDATTSAGAETPEETPAAPEGDSGAGEK